LGKVIFLALERGNILKKKEGFHKKEDLP